MSELEEIIQHKFARPALLREALTHSSAVGEGESDYQRLEFLGDRVLGLVIATELLEKEPSLPEGDLAPRLNNLVRRETLAEAGLAIGLDRYLRVGPGEKDSKGRGRMSIVADVFESVLGAIYLDGGLAPARDFTLRALAKRIATVDELEPEPKSKLQELLQGRGEALPRYKTVDRSGPDHQPHFTVRVSAENGDSAEGTGGSKREAERNAARALLEALSK